MTGDEHPDTTTDEETGGGTIPDGGQSRRRPIERIQRVETRIEHIGNTANRIEDKVDTLHEDIERVEENSLDKEQFDQVFRDRIFRNSRVTSILKWGGVVALGASGAAATLLVDLPW